MFQASNENVMCQGIDIKLCLTLSIKDGVSNFINIIKNLINIFNLKSNFQFKLSF